jgi:hypothetical protein
MRAAGMLQGQGGQQRETDHDAGHHDHQPGYQRRHQQQFPARPQHHRRQRGGHHGPADADRDRPDRGVRQPGRRQCGTERDNARAA